MWFLRSVQKYIVNANLNLLFPWEYKFSHANKAAYVHLKIYFIIIFTLFPCPPRPPPKIESNQNESSQSGKCLIECNSNSYQFQNRVCPKNFWKHHHFYQIDWQLSQSSFTLCAWLSVPEKYQLSAVGSKQGINARIFKLREKCEK